MDNLDHLMSTHDKIRNHLMLKTSGGQKKKSLP
ncbi:hypothetical protein JZO67_004958 [Enterococcus sp. 665A]|uniref:Uncharacterized protein n=1 Tax=Candidatus Enterococcus ferrettii TaxID=2815324 RepID=A0ABV0EWE4_9ENTE